MAPDDQNLLLQRTRELQARLDEAEETLRAIRSGEVDAIVAAGPDGDRVYTLRGADEAYRAMVEGMAEGALTLTVDGVILFSNEQFANIVRSPLERVIGSRIQEFAAPEDAEVVSALLMGSKGRKAEVRLQSQGAPPVPVYLSVQNLVLDGAECLCLMVTDLTAQKRNEAIVAAERLARSILEQAAEAILVVDPDGRISRASRAAARLAGTPVVQRAFDDVFRISVGSGTDYPFPAILSAAIRSREIKDIEATAVAPDGRKIESLLSAAVLSGPDSELLGCVLNVTDITERKRKERQLKFQADIIETTAEAVVAVDPDYRVTFWNSAAERLYGVSWEEALGKPLTDLYQPLWLHPEDKRQSEAVLEKHGMWSGEKIHVRRDGTQFFADATVTVIGREHGGGRFAVIRDITERKRAEEHLRQSQKLESLGLLAGGVAHDFNNLLVGVIGNASLAQEMLPPDNPATELLERVIKIGEQAARLTRQMLTYSGKGKLAVEALNLSALIPELNDLVRPSIPKKIELQFELERNLPPIEADRGQLHQVLMNLVLNAAEAIGANTGLISIKTGVQAVDERYIRRNPEAADLCPGKYVYLEVRDTGCGMDAATKTKIFDPFFTTKFTWHGLGLAAVSGIVRGHKGAIQLASAPGEGSCFTVLFPAAQGEVATRQAAGYQAASGGVGTVLVVDDEEFVRDLAQKALTNYGFDVLLANNAPEAIDILKRYPGDIALVVLDRSMPGMSAEEALPQLRKIRPRVKVVISSGYGQAETMALFDGERVSGFIQKPYTPGMFANKVKSILGLALAVE
jgi:two-component system, cell cycle sensor histidine kinase and response regulator CckA